MEKKLVVSLELLDKFNDQLKGAFKKAQDQVRNINFNPQHLQNLQKLAVQMQREGLSTPWAPTNQQVRQAQLRAEEEHRIRLEKANRVITQTEERYRQITKELKNQNLELKERERLEKQLERVMQYRAKAEGVAFAETGVSPVKKTGVSGFLSGLTTMKGALSAVIATQAFKFIRSGLEEIAAAPINITAMQGSAVAGILGKNLQQMQSGRFLFESMYGTERQKSLAAGGRYAGAQTLMDVLHPSRWMGFFTGEEESRFTKLREQGFNKSLEGLKQQEAYKTDAIDRLQNNMMSYLTAQRTLGMGDRDLFSFLSSFTASGFTPEQGQQMMQNIIGAGGSTSMGRRSVMALQAQRGLNLTNAGQLLGQLSGTLGSAEESKNALIEIVAHGLDRSKFAAENRRFAENVAQLANKAGVTSKEAVSDLSEMMRNFITGTTTQRGIKAGATAFQAISQMASTTTGYMGALNVASLMNLPGAGNIKDPMLLEALASMKLEEINPQNDIIRSAAIQMHVSPEQLSSRLRHQKFQTIRTATQRPKAMERATGTLETMFRTSGGRVDMSKVQLGADLGPIEAALKILHPGLGMPELRQAATGLVTEQTINQMMNKPQYAPIKRQLEESRKKAVEQANEAMESKNTGRKMDELVSISASQAATSLKTLASSIDQLTAAAARFEQKRMQAEPLSRQATAVSHATAHASLFGFGTEAFEAAQQIRQNIQAGRDPYEGVLPLQRWAYERYAKTQIQATTPSPHK